MGKNVAVFVDVANIFYAAKAAGVDVDYVNLLKHASSGRDLVRAYAYTGLDPDNENQRNFHSFLSRHGYKVVSKDIRKYGDGKVKANLDIELVVDMMKTARNLDIAIVVSGDGDFAPAIRAVQEMGVRCEVISFRGNTSSDLIEAADLFTDITKISQTDRVPVREREADEADLSMTVVPEKESEGTGRGRGRGRGRAKPTEEKKAEPRVSTRRSSREPGAETAPVAARGRGRAKPVVEEPAAVGGEPAAVGGEILATGGGLVALPGEKLSKASRPAKAVAAAAIVDAEEELEEVVEELETGEELDAGEVGVTREAGEAGEDAGSADGGRRRRRRGGRGRGRGRGGRDGVEVPQGPDGVVIDIDQIETIRLDDVEEEAEADELPTRPATRATFGSVWDGQLGMPPAPTPVRGPAAPADLDDLDEEPEIPEYLIAERRRGQGSGQVPGGRSGRGGQQARGGRAGYSTAVDRERYGRGGGVGRAPEPARGPRVDRPAPVRSGRADRPERSQSGEGFSEVPPELEAMLRAQLAQRQGAGGGGRAPQGGGRGPSGSGADAPRDEAPAARRRGGRSAAGPATDPTVQPVAAETQAVTTTETPAVISSGSTPDEAPARGRGRSRTRKPAAATDAGETATSAEAPTFAEAPAIAAMAMPADAPKPVRATRSRKAAGEAAPAGDAA
ncbi:MAG: NYN domain-containing protein, partial [Chloroflexota bacterium]